MEENNNLGVNNQINNVQQAVPVVEKTKGNGGLKVIIVLLILVILGMVAFYFFYLKPKQNPTIVPDTNVVEEPKEQEPKEPEKPSETSLLEEDNEYDSYAMSLVVDIYEDGSYKEICSKYNANDCSGKKIKTVNIKVKNEIEYEDCSDCESKKDYKNYLRRNSIFEGKYIIYSDGKDLKIYDIENKKSYYTGIEHTEEYYELVSSNGIKGIIVDSGYYSFTTKSKLYTKGYDSVYQKNHCLVGSKNSKVDLLNMDKEEILATFTSANKEFDFGFNIVSNENNPDKKYYLISIEDGSIDGNIAKIYNSNYKLILDYTSNKKYLQNYMFEVNSDGNPVVIRNETVTTFDSNGKKLDSKKYPGLIKVIDDYKVVAKNNKLMLVAKDETEIVLSSTYNSKKQSVDTLFSTWKKVGNKEGIFVVVHDDSATLNQIWNDCKKYDICEYKSKAELREMMGGKGFYYYYIPDTGETGRIAVDIHI